MDTDRVLFLTTQRHCSHEHQPEPQYLVVFGVVVPAEGVESPHLHPATTQLLTGVIKESTDVRSDLGDITGGQPDVRTEARYAQYRWYTRYR